MNGKITTWATAPWVMPEAGVGQRATIYNNHIYVAGTPSGAFTVKKIDLANTAAGFVASEIPNIPWTSIKDATRFGNLWFIYQSDTSNQRYGRVAVLDLTSPSAWTIYPTLDMAYLAHARHIMLAFAGYLYIFVYGDGGDIPVSAQRINISNPASWDYTGVTDPSFMHGGVELYDGVVHAFYESGNAIATLDIDSNPAGAWVNNTTTGLDFNVGNTVRLTSYATAVMGSRLFRIGGSYSSNGTMDASVKSVDLLNLTASVDTDAPLPVVSRFADCITDGTLVYVMGGDGVGQVPTNAVFIGSTIDPALTVSGGAVGGGSEPLLSGAVAGGISLVGMVSQTFDNVFSRTSDNKTFSSTTTNKSFTRTEV